MLSFGLRSSPHRTNSFAEPPVTASAPHSPPVDASSRPAPSPDEAHPAQPRTAVFSRPARVVRRAAPSCTSRAGACVARRVRLPDPRRGGRRRVRRGGRRGGGDGARVLERACVSSLEYSLGLSTHVVRAFVRVAGSQRPPPCSAAANPRAGASVSTLPEFPAIWAPPRRRTPSPAHHLCKHTRLARRPENATRPRMPTVDASRRPASSPGESLPAQRACAPCSRLLPASLRHARRRAVAHIPRRCLRLRDACVTRTLRGTRRGGRRRMRGEDDARAGTVRGCVSALVCRVWHVYFDFRRKACVRSCGSRRPPPGCNAPASLPARCRRFRSSAYVDRTCRARPPRRPRRPPRRARRHGRGAAAGGRRHPTRSAERQHRVDAYGRAPRRLCGASPPRGCSKPSGTRRSPSSHASPPPRCTRVIGARGRAGWQRAAAAL